MAAVMEQEWHEVSLRVRYAETDKMGVVYHANYLIWFEIGRTEYCRAKGITYRDMEEKDGSFLVVAESFVRYKSPAFYDDHLTIRTRVNEMKKRTLVFEYEIYRASDNTVIALGETTHVVTDKNSRVISFPDSYQEILLKPFVIGSEPMPDSAPE